MTETRPSSARSATQRHTAASTTAAEATAATAESAPYPPAPPVATEVLISNALVRSWTRDPGKVRVYTGDTWFLEAAEQLFELTSDAARIGSGMATLLVKPDGIATGSARTVVDWALRSGFEIHDVAAVSMDHNGIRALWYHQWNIASAERRLLADLLCGLSPALLLVLGRSDDTDDEWPCAVQLTELKGPTAPHLRRLEHLRGVLPGGSYLLNQVHSADEPADALRELGVYFPARRRQRTFERVVTGHDASAEARRIADELDEAHGGFSTEEEPAWEALQPLRRRGESDSNLCRRLLHESIREDLQWPLLVAGAGCLPMRTPSGSVALANPPASAWDPGRPIAAPRGGVDRSMVHRRSEAEFFVTGIGPATIDDEGCRVFEAAVQMARMHPLHSDHVGAQWGHLDLLHLMEGVRQACIAGGQTAFGAKRSDVFVVRSFGAEFSSGPPAFDGQPLDLRVRVTADREYRENGDGPVTGLRASIDITDDEAGTVGRAWGTYSWVSRDSFLELRRAMRAQTQGGAQPPAQTEPATPLPLPPTVAESEVLRLDPRSSVVSREGAAPGELVLAVDVTHPVHFDHPLDHIPGMLLLEAARQAALLTIDPADRAGKVVSRVDAKFVSFADYDRPVTIRTLEIPAEESADVPYGGAQSGAGPAGDDGTHERDAQEYRVEFVQDDQVATVATVVVTDGGR